MKPSELKPILKVAIEHKLPVLLTGAPGIGKSDLVAEAAKESGAELQISHPVISDPTDYKGLPYANGDGSAKFLPYGDLKALIEAPALTCAFLDDIGQAPPTVQAALMQLLLARRIGEHAVSPHVAFLAATNRRKDRAGVQGVLEPVKSRFFSILELTVDVDDWRKWALKADVPTWLIAFIGFRPDLLHWELEPDLKKRIQPSADMVNIHCPRTVTALGRLSSVGIDNLEAWEGAAGAMFAAEAAAFYRIWQSMPNLDGIIQNPDTSPVPSKEKDGNTWLATTYAVVAGLAHKATEINLAAILRYSERLPKEYQVLLVNDATARNGELRNTRACIEWYADNAGLFS